MIEKTNDYGATRALAEREQRTLIAIGCVLVAALGVCVVLAGRLLTSSFDAVESRATEQQARQAYQAFNADLRQLEVSNRDFAERDSVARFVTQGDRSYPQSHFNADTMGSVDINVVRIIDRKGRELYSAAFDEASRKVTTPAPLPLLASFERYLRVASGPAGNEPAKRLIRTPLGLAAFSVREITRGDHTGHTGALMLFARVIDASELARVGQAVSLPLGFNDIPAATSNAPVLNLPAAVRAWALNPGDRDQLAWHDSDTQVTGYALVRDIDGAPAALLSTSVPRDIYVTGHRITWLLLGSIAALILAASACVGWLLVRLRRLYRASQAAAQRYSSIAAQLHEPIALIDADTGRIVDANAAALAALGCTRDALWTSTVFDLFPDLDPAALENARCKDGSPDVHESRMLRRGSEPLDAEVSITRLDGPRGPLLALIGHDISHRKEAARQQRANTRRLVHLAQHDPLTGLPNRAYLRARLPRALRHAGTSDRLLALVYLDVDHFKYINDTHGHGVGDQVLQVIARRLRSAVAAHDVVVRMGGDEFVIVATLLPDVAAVDALALRLQAAVRAHLAVQDLDLEVSASMGIALYPQDGLDMETLLRHSDIALYQAKAAGRHCHQLFSPDMQVRASENLALEQAMRHGFGTEQFSMEYQPIVDLNTGRVCSLEALMRWRHPELGIIPPSQFIPVAEASGLNLEIGMFALRAVLEQLQAWMAAQVPLVPVAVNICPRHLESADFCEWVRRLCAEYNVEPRWLRFEITESVLLKDPEKLVGTLRRLREMGSQVLIDDFGTGYSGLAYLARLPVDTIKIDRSFIGGLNRDNAGQSIVGNLIEMARKLKMDTLAEGVESAEHASVLRELGCSFGQGYHFSKPMSARHCRKLLDSLGWEQALTATLVSRTLDSA